MVLIEDDHLVARPEFESPHDDVVRLGGVAHDGDLVGRGAQVAGQPVSHRFLALFVLRPVLEGDIRVNVPHRLHHPVNHHARGRTEVGGIHGRDAVAQNEVRADLPPVGFVHRSGRGRKGRRRRGQQLVEVLDGESREGGEPRGAREQAPDEAPARGVARAGRSIHVDPRVSGRRPSVGGEPGGSRGAGREPWRTSAYPARAEYAAMPS